MMAWDLIERNVSKTSVPKEGAVVSSRGAMKGSRYISVLLGAETAHAGLLRAEQHRVLVMLGRDEHNGQIAIQLDASQGKFDAKRQKNGAYRITINNTPATSRLEFDMPMVTVEDVKLVPMRNGGPPMLVVNCPEAFAQPKAVA